MSGVNAAPSYTCARFRALWTTSGFRKSAEIDHARVLDGRPLPNIETLKRLEPLERVPLLERLERLERLEQRF